MSPPTAPALHPSQQASTVVTLCWWPLASSLELGALPTAVSCARLHAKHLAWEWGLTGISETIELLVSELTTNSVQAMAGHDGQPVIRLRLLSDYTRVRIEVWDADPRPPAPKDLGQNGTPDPQEEGGRGLFLVVALSARWDWYLTREPAGKVVWCEVRALSPARHGVGEGREPPFVRMNRPADTGTAGQRGSEPVARSSPRIPECLRRWLRPRGLRRYGFCLMRQQRAYGESGT